MQAAPVLTEAEGKDNGFRGFRDLVAGHLWNVVTCERWPAYGTKGTPEACRVLLRPGLDVPIVTSCPIPSHSSSPRQCFRIRVQVCFLEKMDKSCLGPSCPEKAHPSLDPSSVPVDGYHTAHYPTQSVKSSLMGSPAGSQRKPRKLVLCFDGTGNKFRGDDSDSSILKIYRMLDRTADDQCQYAPNLPISEPSRLKLKQITTTNRK